MGEGTPVEMRPERYLSTSRRTGASAASQTP